jgi:hypothetical protein
MRARITFEVEIPNGVSEDEADEWLRYELNETAQIGVKNPLCHKSVEPIANTMLIDFE